MRTKRDEPVENVQEPQAEPIGHITTPIADKELARVRTICSQHGITMIPCQTDVNWWTLLLPKGSTQTLTNVEGKVKTYTVLLPDGYRFLYRAPVFSGHDK